MRVLDAERLGLCPVFPQLERRRRRRDGRRAAQLDEHLELGLAAEAAPAQRVRLGAHAAHFKRVRCARSARIRGALRLAAQLAGGGPSEDWPRVGRGEPGQSDRVLPQELAAGTALLGVGSGSAAPPKDGPARREAAAVEARARGAQEDDGGGGGVGAIDVAGVVVWAERLLARRGETAARQVLVGTVRSSRVCLVEGSLSPGERGSGG